MQAQSPAPAPQHELDPHLCFGPLTKKGLDHGQGKTVQEDLFEAADNALKTGDFFNPLVGTAVDICLLECTQREACQGDVTRFLNRRVTATIRIDTTDTPFGGMSRTPCPVADNESSNWPTLCVR